MAEVTITYSPDESGWTSRWSYTPDWMIGLNNNFYSWKDGSLYKHNSNSSRNTFYGVAYPSIMTTVFNDNPELTKMFKTIGIDSTHSWDVALETDLNTGFIDSSYLQNKEGNWFAFIRRTGSDNDYKMLSTQGIGALGSFTGSTMTFNFGIGSGISQLDSVYRILGDGTLELVGIAQNHGYNTITLSSVAVTPSPGDVIVYVKDSIAESYGARGYYMQVTLTNDNTEEVELFMLSSSVFKSNQ